MFNLKKVLLIALITFVALGGGVLAYFNLNDKIAKVSAPLVVEKPKNTNKNAQPAVAGVTTSAGFGNEVKYEAPNTAIAADVSNNFKIAEIKNIAAMEKAYGFKFTAAELKTLEANKFILKDLNDTSIRPTDNRMGNGREFYGLYEQVNGDYDYKKRLPENALFYSADVFTNSYNNIYTELLKEMENKVFYPAMKSLSKKFYDSSAANLAAAKTTEEQNKWTKLRNYFALPYAIFETAAETLSARSYLDVDGSEKDPVKVQADYQKQDATVDTYENAAAFVAKLGLDKANQEIVLKDLKNTFDAEGKATPEVFFKEYKDYAKQENIEFQVDFTQFTPRATYTSSSLRREYFRGMKWYIMLPFFVKSADLTSYAFGISQLLAEDAATAKDYDKLESAINFMVGTSDDLMPVDYLKALEAAKNAPDKEAAILDYLTKAHNPKIKDLPAFYPAVGEVQSSDVLLATKGMRFFSGKFIIDSYWTGQLTQGDEALKPGYDQKLPPMASSLEVMALLGSDYAKSQISKLDFYKPTNSRAIEKAMTDLAKENATLTDADWMKDLYTGWLWTIKGLFSWQKDNAKTLPRFMQSDAWQAKVLQTASAFWTELRHATILYAKQSFSELGGGGDGCDSREVPAPPKGYIEPQLTAYARLEYLAKKTQAGLEEQGYDLANMYSLESFVKMMERVNYYSKKELENASLNENVVTETYKSDDASVPDCTTHNIVGESDWENIRRVLTQDLESSLPIPVEGPILFAKDKRAAIVADVHTGGDMSNPTRILYEGTGVPYVIFTAVKDANGPRLTVGFTYSHYEFTKEYGGKRMTDEDWQKNFYKEGNTFDAYNYAAKSLKPALNYWYKILFPGK